MTSLPDRKIGLFFDHSLTYCNYDSRQVLCLKEKVHWTVSKIRNWSEISEDLKNLKVDANYKVKIAEDYVSYLKKKKLSQDRFDPNSNEWLLLKIKDMYKKYPSKHLDWLQMINNLLLSDAQQTLDDEIVIENPQLLKVLHELFTELEEP